MKNIVVILIVLIALASCRRHHHSHDKHLKHKEENYTDKEKCKKCVEFAESSPRLWNNVLFCGNKNEPQHHLELSDAEVIIQNIINSAVLRPLAHVAKPIKTA